MKLKNRVVVGASKKHPYSDTHRLTTSAPKECAFHGPVYARNLIFVTEERIKQSQSCVSFWIAIIFKTYGLLYKCPTYLSGAVLEVRSHGDGSVSTKNTRYFNSIELEFLSVPSSPGVVVFVVIGVVVVLSIPGAADAECRRAACC